MLSNRSIEKYNLKITAMYIVPSFTYALAYRQMIYSFQKQILLIH